MNEIGIGEQKKVTMAELLEKNVLYTVPIFQREYSWKKDELSDLYEDLERSLSSNSQHFFGFMMIKPDDKTYVNVIEGQQRLATVTIILCVIRDILFNMNDDLHRDIETKYIKTINIFRKDSPANYKVSLSKTNKSYFRELIQERNDPETKLEHIRTSKNIHPSNKLIQNAYKYFYTTISQKIQNFVERNKLKHLTKLLEMLLTNFVVITTEVYDSKTAYNVFQTLND